MNAQTHTYDTIVIGAGQAGLATGYYLQRAGRDFVILDANERVGDSWRRRWDSLRLFTPARYCGLPGMRFPARGDYFPTKDEMGDYLEAYARHFELPVRTGVRVTCLARRKSRFAVEAGDRLLMADNVVVAMANWQAPRVPAFAHELDQSIVQLHSSEYRSPAQLQPGPVLVVGAGNSGAEIAVEVAADHPTWLAGRPTGQLPFRIDSPVARLILVWFVLRLFFHRVLTVRTPLGRKVRPKLIGHGMPLVRMKDTTLEAAGVRRASRVVGVQNGRLLLEGDQTVEAANVIWCTGYDPGFSWIDDSLLASVELPPIGGVVEGEPGLYFVGLSFLYAASSSMIHGVARDAARVVQAVDARSRAAVRGGETAHIRHETVEERAAR